MLTILLASCGGPATYDPLGGVIRSLPSGESVLYARTLAAADEDGPPAGVVAVVREIAEMVEAILENQRALEARMSDEYSRLRKELRDLDRESRLKQYLELQKQVESKIDLKK